MPHASPVGRALAAAVTPLRDEGRALDEAAIEPLVDFLAEGGLDGALVGGTTGEGVLLAPHERERLTEAWVTAARGRLRVVVHAGAQTTGDAVRLAAHAAEAGADAVAVIGPPYYAFDAPSLVAHFAAAAQACAPLPFYLYAFAARTGYVLPVAVVEEVRERCSTVRGIKVSEASLEAVRPYLLEGLDVFVGAEELIPAARAAGAAGAVSGLASAFPELVAAAVADPTPERGEHLGELRGALRALPFEAALKEVLRERGVPMAPDVRAPLRALTEAERDEVSALLRLEAGAPQAS